MRYRLHVPPQIDPNVPAPLLVALHGCRQTAADFAAGTRFDALADERGLMVVYPEQEERANGNRCWNWYLPQNQRREGTEPGSVIGVVDELTRTHTIDRERVFLAGLSAGGAMAAILAEQAPDIFAAVGIMAGIPLHASHDVTTAYAAMRGEIEPDPGAFARVIESAPADRFGRLRAIIWTGSRDRRVDPVNARRLAEQFRALTGLPERAQAENATGGMREVWPDAGGRARVELRVLEGVGHAWSGGSLRGSFTDPEGPDASEAMLNFFLGEGDAA